MSTNQPHGLQGALDAAMGRFVGLLSLFVGAWMLVMTGYMWAAVPVILAGAVLFPLTRPLVTFGRLGVGRRLHDFVTFLLWGALLFLAVIIAQPWA